MIPDCNRAQLVALNKCTTQTFNNLLNFQIVVFDFKTLIHELLTLRYKSIFNHKIFLHSLTCIKASSALSLACSSLSLPTYSDNSIGSRASSEVVLSLASSPDSARNLPAAATGSSTVASPARGRNNTRPERASAPRISPYHVAPVHDRR